MLVPLVFAVVRTRLKEGIRQRVTYPRVGYLSEQPGEPPGLDWRALGLLMIVLLAAPTLLIIMVTAGITITGGLPSLKELLSWTRWIPAVIGTLFALISWWDSSRADMPQLRVSAVLLCAVSIAASLATRHPVIANVLFFAGWGAVNACTGAFTLWRFAATPPADASA